MLERYYHRREIGFPQLALLRRALTRLGFYVNESVWEPFHPRIIQKMCKNVKTAAAPAEVFLLFEEFEPLEVVVLRGEFRGKFL